MLTILIKVVLELDAWCMQRTEKCIFTTLFYCLIAFSSSFPSKEKNKCMYKINSSQSRKKRVTIMTSDDDNEKGNQKKRTFLFALLLFFFTESLCSYFPSDLSGYTLHNTYIRMLTHIQIPSQKNFLLFEGNSLLTHIF